MGDPAVKEDSAETSPVTHNVDRPTLSDTGQTACEHHIPPTTTSLNHSDTVLRDENGDKLSPRHKRYSDTQSSARGVQGGGGGGGGNGGGVSVTLLTLDADLEPPRPHSRQHFLPSPRVDRDPDMSDLRLIRDFQVRKKYGRRHAPIHVRAPKQNQTVVELGLSGTRYFTQGDSTPHGATPASLDGSKKTPHITEDSGRLPNSTQVSSTVPSKFRTEEDLSSVESAPKDLPSPVPSFPPLSPGGFRNGLRSENTFYASSSSRSMGQSPPSLLSNHFGFSTIRPDTFSGMQRQRRMRLAGTSDNDELLKELEQHAQRQILACQNMGYAHRGSRAAESVLSLKHTVSPSAFHPPSFFTRHKPTREDRSGTPAGGVGGESEDGGKLGGGGRGRRVTAAGKLGGLMVPDRQEKAARRTAATLPSVSGNSLQVVLAQSHGK